MALPSPLLRRQPQIKRQRVGNRGVVDQIVRKVQTRLFRPAGLSELGWGHAVGLFENVVEMAQAVEPGVLADGDHLLIRVLELVYHVLQPDVVDQLSWGFL